MIKFQAQKIVGNRWIIIMKLQHAHPTIYKRNSFDEICSYGENS
jgi:hypothetical protein